MALGSSWQSVGSKRVEVYIDRWDLDGGEKRMVRNWTMLVAWDRASTFATVARAKTAHCKSSAARSSGGRVTVVWGTSCYYETTDESPCQADRLDVTTTL